MWIAIDPDHPRRRIAFGDEEYARSYADKLTPAWTVRPAEPGTSGESVRLSQAIAGQGVTPLT